MKITDRARLDFMQAAPQELYRVYEGWIVGYSLSCSPKHLAKGATMAMPSVRAAIDAAIKASARL